ncbi:metallophosphoesterase [Phycisphaeraceae bacterium D3-23]
MMQDPAHPTRRMFLTTAAAGLASSAVLGGGRLPWRARAAEGAPARPLTIGLITDLHHGNLTPDADERLDAFLQHVADRGDVDLLMQLGDFCHPADDARGLCERFNAFEGPKLHVLGNHDMDLGTKQEIMDLWGMPARYGSTDIGGVHFVTLDRNNLKTDAGFTPYANANFYVDGAIRAWADDAQLEWLAADLAETDLPTIVLTHQPLGVEAGGVADASPQAAPIMRLLEQANEDAGWAKVQACFCGHYHIDDAQTHAGIHYLQFNSVSYKWVREPVRYDEALFAFVTLDPAGTLSVEGRSTAWADPPPEARELEGDFPAPAISDREMDTATPPR